MFAFSSNSLLEFHRSETLISLSLYFLSNSLAIAASKGDP
jgi:hypothetical protein